MVSSPRVSLIVVNYNGKSKLSGLLDDCLSSVLHTDYENFELLFCDNGSNDGSAEYVERTYTDRKVRILRLPSNLGYAGAANLAVQQVNGEIVGVLNNDIVVKPRWLTMLVDILLAHPLLSVVSPVLVSDENTIDSFGGTANILLFAWDLRSRDNDIGSRGEIAYVLYPPGAAFLFKREFLEEVNGEILDADYFAYYEDVWLGLQCNLVGHKVAVVPNCTVLHRRSSTWGSISPEAFYLLHRNRIWTAIRIFNAKEVFILLPIWMLLAAYSGYLTFRLTRNPRFLKTAASVMLDVIEQIPLAWAKHAKFQSVKPSDASVLQLSRSFFIPSGKPTIPAKFAIFLVNAAAHLAGLAQFTITDVRAAPTPDRLSK